MDNYRCGMDSHEHIALNKFKRACVEYLPYLAQKGMRRWTGYGFRGQRLKKGVRTGARSTCVQVRGTNIFSLEKSNYIISNSKIYLILYTKWMKVVKNDLVW